MTDIDLINNATQTLRRAAGSYAALVEAERTRPLNSSMSSPPTMSVTRTRPPWPAASPPTRRHTR